MGGNRKQKARACFHVAAMSTWLTGLILILVSVPLGLVMLALASFDFRPRSWMLAVWVTGTLLVIGTPVFVVGIILRSKDITRKQ